MDYRQFLRSAERHLSICQQLLERFNAVADDNLKKYILLEVYYLSGYVLEMGLSYALFSHVRYSGDIYSSDHYNNNGFKTHNIAIKYRYLTQHFCVINDLVFVSIPHKNKALQTLYTEWDVKYRYENYHDLKRSVLESYISELQSALNTIKIHYPL